MKKRATSLGLYVFTLALKPGRVYLPATESSSAEAVTTRAARTIILGRHETEK